jgi:hypothetical protein
MQLVSQVPLQCIVGERDATKMDSFYDAFETAEESALEMVHITRPPRIYEPTISASVTARPRPDTHLMAEQHGTDLSAPLHAALGPPGRAVALQSGAPWAHLEADDVPLPIPNAVETLETIFIDEDEDARAHQLRVLRRPDGSKMGGHFKTAIIEGKTWMVGFDGTYLKDRGQRFPPSPPAAVTRAARRATTRARTRDATESRPAAGLLRSLGGGGAVAHSVADTEIQEKAKLPTGDQQQRNSGWGFGWLTG